MALRYKFVTLGIWRNDWHALTRHGRPFRRDSDEVWLDVNRSNLLRVLFATRLTFGRVAQRAAASTIRAGGDGKFRVWIDDE